MKEQSQLIETIEFTDPVEKAANGGYTHLEISVDYLKGGINYFSGERFPRGYRLSFQPCNIIQHEGYSTKEFSLTGHNTRCGKYAQIEEANRFNRTRLQKLAAQVDAKRAKELWLANDGNALVGFAATVSQKANV